MSLEIRHLSVSVKHPELAAKALAEITGGEAETFSSRNMTGAWVCIWDRAKNSLVEFLPNNYLMYETEYGADFQIQEKPQSFNSTHFQLEVGAPLSHIKAVAEKYGLRHKFRPNRGGPLYDVWFEAQLLVEFTSDEIRSLAV